MTSKEEKLQDEIDKLKANNYTLNELCKQYEERREMFLKKLTILLELPQQADEDDILQEIEKFGNSHKKHLIVEELQCPQKHRCGLATIRGRVME